MKKLLNYFIMNLIFFVLVINPVLADERSYNVNIDDSADYLIEKFQWNSEYNLTENVAITLESKTVELVKNYHFVIVVKSTGNEALLCDYDDGTNTLEVICSNSFLNPYMPALIQPVYASLDDWKVYADGIESVKENIAIDVDSQYYKESEVKNSSGIIENRYLKFNVQNGILREYYYQYYEGNDFKNYREVEITRLDEETWTTPETIATSPGGAYYLVVLSLLSIHLMKRRRNASKNQILIH